MNTSLIFVLILNIVTIVINTYGIILNIFHTGNFAYTVLHIVGVLLCSFQLSIVFEGKTLVADTDKQ